jgi:hypothetical protein
MVRKELQMSQNNKNSILPLGSIVQLVDGDSEQLLLIIGRAVISNMDGKQGYFDYAAVLYPYGLVDPDQLSLFNMENVSKVIFTGYSDAKEVDYQEGYDQSVKESGFEQLKVEK